MRRLLLHVINYWFTILQTSNLLFIFVEMVGIRWCSIYGQGFKGLTKTFEGGHKKYLIFICNKRVKCCILRTLLQKLVAEQKGNVEWHCELAAIQATSDM